MSETNLPQKSPEPTLRIDHAIVYVADLQASKRFYVDVLGLNVPYEDEEMVQVQGRGEFSLLLEVDDDKKGGTGIDLELLVDDVDAEFERLKQAGVSFDADPEDMYWGARHAFFKDPDGYTLSIFRPLEDS
jgi:lactoylglutathione lyase